MAWITQRTSDGGVYVDGYETCESTDYGAIPVYTTPPAPAQPLTDEQVLAGARVLNNRMAEQCGVDADDQWTLYADDFKADARAMLEAAHGVTKGGAV